MVRWKPWFRPAPRWAASLACGTAVALGAGCRSSDSQADVPRLSPAVQSALRPTEGLAAGAASRGLTGSAPRTYLTTAARTSWTQPGALVSGPIIPVAGSGAGGGIKRLGGEEPAKGQKELKGWAPQPTVTTTQAGSDTSATLPGGTTSAETIDLGIALRLAGVDNPTINLAREQIREAQALLLGARSLLLPSVNIGGNFHLHRGTLQTSYGEIRHVSSQSLYMGFGARTLAAESVAFPGVRIFAHLGDAVYEPLAARQVVVARRADAQAVQNETLLRVSVAYMNLVGAEARLEVLRRGEIEGAEVARLTQAYAAKGQGRQGDADRAAAREALIQQQTRRAEGEVVVASAELCRLLNLDPSVRLRTPGGPVLPVPLIAEDCDPEALTAEAVRNRPELFARAADIQGARIRVRQEQTRPFIPTLSVGYSGGIFGGGSNLVGQNFGPLTGRTDFDVLAFWNVQNLGFGNRARVRTADAVVGEAMANYDRMLNEVRREVSEALADAKSAARQIQLARTAVATAEEGFKLETERIRLGQGLPIEVLDSFRQLVQSRQELVLAIVDYNEAQFRLFVALGSSPLSGPAEPAAPSVIPTPPMMPPPPKS